MANYANLKAAIQAVIKTNGNEEITGAVMQSSLLSMINNLAEGYLFAGVATPSTNAGSPDQNVFYIGGAGTYANFGTSVTIPDGSLGVFRYNGAWSKDVIPVIPNIDDYPSNGSSHLVRSNGIYGFVGDFAVIYGDAVPVFRAAAHTFKLPAGSYLFHKNGTISSTPQDVTWTRSEGQTSVLSCEYLILNVSDFSHRVVHAALPKCNENECVIALVDWWDGVIKCYARKYDRDGTIIPLNFHGLRTELLDKILSPYRCFRPVFWGNGSMDIVVSGTTVQVRLTEESFFVLPHTYVKIAAMQSYKSVVSNSMVAIGLTKSGETWELALMELTEDEINSIDNFYVLTYFFVNPRSTTSSRFTYIDCSYDCSVTIGGITKKAEEWAYRALISPFIHDEKFYKRFLYDGRDRAIVPTITLHPTNGARAVSGLIPLNAGEQYLFVSYHPNTNYMFKVVNSAMSQDLGGAYSTKSRLVTIPNDGYIFILLAKNDGTNFTSSEIEEINSKEYYVIYDSNTMALAKTIFPLRKSTNLFNDYAHEYGYYYASSNGVKYSNSNMVNAIIDVVPNSMLVLRYLYVQVAFYDNNMNFISGVTYNAEYNVFNEPFQTVSVPSYAVKAAVSVRKPQEKMFSVSEFLYADKELDRVSNADNVIVPETSIVCQSLRKIFDIKEFCPDSANLSLDYGNVTIQNSKAIIATGGFVRLSASKFITIDKETAGMKCVINNINGNDWIFRFVLYGSSYSGTGVSDSDVWVSIHYNRIEIYKGNWKSGVAQQIMGSANLTETLSVGDEVDLRLIKDTIYHYKVELCKNSIIIGNIEVTASVDPNDADKEINQMRGWGMPAIYVGTTGASITVSRFFFYSDGAQYVRIAALGDSYVENFSRSKRAGWVRLLAERLGEDNVFIAGMGGASATNMIRRLPIELTLCKADYVVLNVGTNDGTTASGAESYKTNMATLINMVKNIRATPVLITTPRRTDNDNINFMNVVNPWVRNSGYMYIDVAIALSNGDGVTQDASKYMSDGVHPNGVGAQAIINWIDNNLQEIL